MIEVAALVLPVVLGYLAVRLVKPAAGLSPRWAAVLLEVALGFGAGAAITSTIFFLLVVTGLSSRGTQLILELAVLTGLAAWGFLRREKAEPAPADTPRFRFDLLLAIVLGVALLLVAGAQVNEAQFSPHGNWDAFAIWNLRAKYLLGDADLWTRAASPLMLGRTHPESPMLLSSFVARTWQLGGNTSSAVAGFAIGVMFFWSLLLLLATALALSRGVASALLSVFLLLTTSSLLDQSTWQYADIPVGGYYLSTLVLLLLSTPAGGRRATLFWAAAGASAGMAAWTKNEGLPFLACAVVCFAAVMWRREGMKTALAKARWLVVGAAPGLMLLAGFRLYIAPDTGFLRGQTASQIFDKLLSLDRYIEVLSAAISTVGDLGPWWVHPLAMLVLLAVLLRFEVEDRHRVMLWSGSATVAMTIAAYCGAYVVSPDDLEWVLPNSLSRLYTQVWPSVLLLAFLAIGRPRDPQAEAPPVESKDKRKRKKKR